MEFVFGPFHSPAPERKQNGLGRLIAKENWSVPYDILHTPAFCGKQIFALSVCIRSTVHYQDVLVPPKYQRIQLIALKYTANNSDILSTQCSTLELIQVTGSSGSVCLAPECDKWDHLNCISSRAKQPVVKPKI